jgi:hypothetical protein
MEYTASASHAALINALDPQVRVQRQRVIADNKALFMKHETKKSIECLLRRHLPYELNMLEHTFRLLHSSQDYAKGLRSDGVVANALIESFWTHARNLIEFFNQGKSDGSTGVASAQDMTDGYLANTNMRTLDQMINVQISHLQYNRPLFTDQLNLTEMERVRNAIARELEKFKRCISPTYRDAWTAPAPIDRTITDEAWLKIATEQPTATNVVRSMLATIVPKNR